MSIYAFIVVPDDLYDLIPKFILCQRFPTSTSCAGQQASILLLVLIILQEILSIILRK